MQEWRQEFEQKWIGGIPEILKCRGQLDVGGGEISNILWKGQGVADTDEAREHQIAFWKAQTAWRVIKCMSCAGLNIFRDPYYTTTEAVPQVLVSFGQMHRAN